MQLALAHDALREVVPCGALATLPCAAPCVVGGVDLRGVLVPVVDLRRILGLSCEDRVDDAPRSIVIMEHQGFSARPAGPRLLLGVSTALPGAGTGWWRAIGGLDSGRQFPACGDDATLVSVLSPEGLAGLQGVPMVVDPSPARQAGGQDVVANDLPAESYLMLVRSGKVPMALASEKVPTTILHPRIQPSP